MHIAMWSGPRNLSTAMMYSFASRSDTRVLDEPFYGAYLSLTGENHPMGDQIMASMECDPTQVSEVFKDQPNGILYSKQMTHHMVEGVPRTWFKDTIHAFLIRHPARVVASYAAKRAQPKLLDLGFVQQAEIFDQVRGLGQTPVVIDSYDIRADPKVRLKALCEQLGILWDPSMLSWQTGGIAADGVWAKHWYGSAHKSTGFAAPEAELPQLEKEMQKLVDAAMPFYDSMAAFKI